MKYAIALGTAEVTTQLLCYPINHRSAVCQYVVFPVMAVLHIQYTAYWIGVTVLFMLLCDAYASMYAELPTEIVSRCGADCTVVLPLA